MAHSRDAAEEILAPHIPALGEIFPVAWDRWESFGETMPELRMDCCPRTRASMVSNFAVVGARGAFADKAPGVVLHDAKQFLLIEFESQLCLRLNKFRDGSRQMSGISTHQRLAFGAQEPLTGMPDSTNLVLGYEVNADGTGITSTAISCSTNGRVNWEIEIPLSLEIVAFQPPERETDPAQPQLSSGFTREGAHEGRRT